MNTQTFIDFSYIIATFFFVLGLKKLGSPATARKGNLLSGLGMLIAIIVTLLDKEIISYQYIIGAMAAGTVVGIMAARMVAMTSMPEMVALLNGFGGISSLLVGYGAYAYNPNLDAFTAVTIILSVIIGGITFTGSLLAWGKLNGTIGGKPVIFFGQKFINAALAGAILYYGYYFSIDSAACMQGFYILIGISLLLGILTVIPIGGADMPVVISLLNSFSGLAACSAGFVMQNNLLIVAGCLVGASGIILTNIMCKSMNRTLTNVLFGGFGATSSSGGDDQGDPNPVSVEDAFLMLEAANSVVIVPGYGLAVAQAQHTVRELAEQLEENGCEVRFAIHPVAGRMPGHMNVLLAEANVPYEQLAEMDEVNPTMETVDICMVIGANDVVNPAARDDEGSAIYGMPIINVDYAKTVIVLKRSMGTGFAGIQNPLFFKENTRMLFGDAKNSVQGLVAEFKD